MKREDKKHQDFKDLYSPYIKSLQNTAFRLTKDHMEADDLLQETLYKAYKAINSFQPNTNFRAWIFRILVNTYLTHYRKKSRQPLRVSYDDIEEYVLLQKAGTDFNNEGQSETALKGELFVDEIQTVLDKMPYYFKLVVLLYDIEGFSYQEISKMANIPVGTVMSRLSRGRRLLRQKLKRYAQSKGYHVEAKLQAGYAS